MREASLRLFFALWPEPSVQASLAAWANAAQSQFGGRAISQDSLHMTLAFLGDTDMGRVDTLRQIGERLPRNGIELSFVEIRCWRHNRIAWAAVDETPAALPILVQDLRLRLEAAGFPVERRDFTPHVSLVRNARCSGPPCSPSHPLLWRATRVALVRSILGGVAGSRYKPVLDWELETRN